MAHLKTQKKKRSLELFLPCYFSACRCLLVIAGPRCVVFDKDCIAWQQLAEGGSLKGGGERRQQSFQKRNKITELETKIWRKSKMASSSRHI